jgi:hypothetical protein
VCWESKKGGWIGVLEKNTRSILGIDILEKVSCKGCVDEDKDPLEFETSIESSGEPS